jgi:PKD repeat protein/photosystem II stability/assembly factor-like uncharacterized protein
MNINKRHSKLKVWCNKTPNASYTHRYLLLFFILMMFAQVALAQEWKAFLPQDKVKTHQLTLKDYQQAFAKYWAGNKTKEARIAENESRDENYEKFKRWEWFWQTRVNPATGAFPTTTAWDVYHRYMAQQPASVRQNMAGNWVSMGPVRSTGGYAGIGRTNCIAFSPVDTNTLYVGTAAGGVWKTTDLGAHWTPLGDFNMALGVADMVVENHGGQDIVYLGTGDKDHWDTFSVGVLKSTDGGQTWNTTGLSWKLTDQAMVYRILKDPNDDNTLYVATNKGLYKTVDGGDHFQKIDGHHFREIEFQPGSNTRFYAGDSWGGIFYSDDSGNSWTQVIDKSNQDAGRVAIAVSPDSANVVYGLIAAADNGLFAVYRSNDFGHSFHVVQDTINLLGWKCSGTDDGGQGWYDLVLVADPHNANKIFLGGVNNWTSDDGGKTWHIANHWSNNCGSNDVVHADKHYMAFQPGTNALFECNDGGVYRSKHGVHWTDLTNGMAISQIYRISSAATVTSEVLAGLQDNGTKLFSSSWFDVLGGDGMDCHIDYTDANIQYGEGPNGDIERTTNHWRSSQSITAGLPGKGAWVTPYIIDPKSHKTLYVGYEDVFKSTDQGDHWTKLSKWAGKELQSLAVAPSNNQVIYTATYNLIYKSEDGGNTWKDITADLPVQQASINYITVKNDDPNTVWIAMGGYNDLGVFQTENGGNSWVNISTGLPGIPVNCVIQNKLKTDTTELYAGTDLGVFVKQGLSRWIPFNQNLPKVIVNDLDIQYDTNGGGNLFAATFGRGLWSSSLFSGHIQPIQQALFEADQIKPFVGDTVAFTDLSTNHPTSWKWEFTPNTVTFVDSTSDTSQNPKVIFNAGGNYTVKLTASNADTSYSITMTNYILAIEGLTVHVKANRTTVCSGDTTQLFAVVTGGSGNYTYSWGSDPFGWNAFIQNPVVHPFADSVVYKVSVFSSGLVANGSIKIFRVECTGIHDHEDLLGKVSLFPNPNSGKFTLEAERNILQMKIINQNGAILLKQTVNGKKVVLNDLSLAKGVYFVKITMGTPANVKGTIVRKLVVY